MNLETKVSELSGVGPAYVKKLSKIGIETINDLLFHFPRRYDDFSKTVPIGEAKTGENISVIGEIWQIANKRSRRGITITEAVVADETGTIKAVWFNQPFLKNSLKAGDKVVLAGKLEWNYGTVAMQSPSYEKVQKTVNPPPLKLRRAGSKQLTEDDSGKVRMTDSNDVISTEVERSLDPAVAGLEMTSLRHTGRIVPVYPETEGLTSKWLRYKIQPLLKFVGEIKEYLPEALTKKYGLIDIQTAIKELHFPTDWGFLERAKKRIDFEEMFLLQLAVLSQKKSLEEEKAANIKLDEKFAKEFVGKLGFQLTNAQRRAAFEILKDMEKSTPMNRLLEGDVGSGKTVVAAMAMAMTANANHQSAFIAPTEILAGQHFQEISKLLKNFNVGLATANEVKLAGSKPASAKATSGRQLTGNSKQGKRKEFWNLAKKREVDVVVGTHALLQEKVEFQKLGLVIVDEQHRFGVEQRMTLRKENDEGLMPHFLSMSATPIPRTLTLTVYGDLNISILDEMPPGRKPVITKLIEGIKREEAYKFIDEKIVNGRQVFVICPLIEESDKLGVKSVEKEAERLDKNIFPHRKIGVLHGKLKPAEKEETMARFKNGELDILVSTSVIEVGVDIPNASVMMIEGAERFGLAQLHQFRGRVGRDEHQSYCFLFTESDNETTMKRLSALINTNNGFKLAEADLEIRGPGEIFGTAQHGLPDIKTRNLLNINLIKETRGAAEEFLRDERLENYPLLREKVSRYNIISSLE
ncbi:MAG: ATP-dependent DNA helicase RecG [Patescibacteria group bacterium]|nr:ATP-dependent DNA helicase RecG [Patescibacteria group bacterium]MCL5093792.1 ATP-dependent DNA helicase RecG [Patescibacteria group bacterium]